MKRHLTAGICVLLSTTAAYGARATGDATNSAESIYNPSVHYEQLAISEQDEANASSTSSGGKPVTIEPDNEQPSPNSNNKQLSELNARLDLETGHIYDATKILDSLLAQDKNDPQLLQLAANAENYAGNWPYALELLKQAHALSPENQDITELQKEIRRQHAQGAQVDFDWIKFGDTKEYVSGLSALINATSHVQVGASVKDNYTLGRNIRLSDGRVGDFNGNREAGEAFAQYSAANGQLAKASVFGNNDTAGGGLYYNFLNPLGITQFTGEFQRPYWELPDAVLDDANRDRVAVLHTIKPSAHFTVEGGAGVNRYNLRKTSNVADSITGDFSMTYRIVDEVKYHKPFFDIGYSIDGEYVKSQKRSIDSLGGNTRLLDLFSREIHTPFGEVGYDFNPSTYAEAMAGYQYDRLGGRGPLFEGRLTHEFGEILDAQLRASHGIDSAHSQNNLTTVGGYLRCRF